MNTKTSLQFFLLLSFTLVAYHVLPTTSNSPIDGQKPTKTAAEIGQEITLLTSNQSDFYVSAEKVRESICTCQDNKAKYLSTSLFDATHSHLIAHSTDHLSSADISIIVNIFNDSAKVYQLNKQDVSSNNLAAAKKMAETLGILKKVVIPNFKEEESVIGFENVVYFGETPEQQRKRQEELAAKRGAQAQINERNARQHILARELPEIKSATMDAILAAFGPQDAKKNPPDLAFCIEKAGLTPNDKKELLYGLKMRVTRWNEITHPDDIAAQHKKDAEWEKNRQKILQSEKK